MIIISIAILWVLSISLRIISSGVNSIKKINDRKVISKVNNTKGKKVLKKANNLAGDVVKHSSRILILVIDLLKWCLTAILPVVVVLDIIILVLLTTIGSGYLLLMK